MKKLQFLALAIPVFLFNIGQTTAACTTESTNKLNNLAANVKASSEVKEKVVGPEEGYFPPDGLTQEEYNNYQARVKYYNIYITNITDDLSIEIKNNNTNEVKRLEASEAKEGVLTFEHTDLTAVTTYTITVYSSDKTDCPNTKLITTSTTIPMYNSYSASSMCEGVEEFYLCHEYLSVPTVSYDRFQALVNDYKKGKINNQGEEVKPDSEKEKKGFGAFLKKHKNAVIITSTVIVAVGGLVTVIIVKKQRSKIV